MECPIVIGTWLSIASNYYLMKEEAKWTHMIFLDMHHILSKWESISIWVESHILSIRIFFHFIRFQYGPSPVLEVALLLHGRRIIILFNHFTIFTLLNKEWLHSKILLLEIHISGVMQTINNWKLHQNPEELTTLIL